MCVNKRWIVTKDGNRVLVSCGKCPSCLQQKALNRRNRIENTDNRFGVPIYDKVFATFTYDNDYIPYISLNELNAFLCCWSNRLNVYRDYNRRYFYDINNKQHLYKRYPLKNRTIATFDNDFNRYMDKFSIKYALNHDKFKTVTMKLGHGQFVQTEDKVGVCLNADFQRFIKRLKQILVRNYGFDSKILYFYNSEYGPTTCRPHFHALFFIPRGFYSTFRQALIKAWPFDNLAHDQRFCELAVDASGYLSSYVNCDTSVPTFLRSFAPFRPQHHYSQAFGISCEYFAFPNLLRMYDGADFSYSRRVLKEGKPTTIVAHIPTYVLNRYFPKFKGFNRLSSHEIYYIASKPEHIHEFCNLKSQFYRGRRLGLTEKHCHRIEVMLNNSRKQFDLLCSKYNLHYDFAKTYSTIWTRFASSLKKKLHTEVTDLDDYFELYDNIEDYYTGKVSNSLLDFCLELSKKQHYETDPNLFQKNLQTHDVLTEYYHKYNKDKKIRNYIYKNLINV